MVENGQNRLDGVGRRVAVQAFDDAAVVFIAPKRHFYAQAGLDQRGDRFRDAVGVRAPGQREGENNVGE